MARVCILRGDGARLYFARARRWRNAPALSRAPRDERAAALLESSLSAEAIARVSGAGFYAHGYRRQIDQCCPSDVLWQSRVAQQIQKNEARRGGDDS